jgi:hypothetical protein
VEKKPDGSDNRGRGHQFIPITDFFNTHACYQQLSVT